MTNAYDRAYLLHVRQSLGRMLDFSCHGLGYSARGFWNMFLVSGVAASFEEGDAHFIAGMSGYELAYEVLERCGERFSRVVDPSPPDSATSLTPLPVPTRTRPFFIPEPICQIMTFSAEVVILAQSTTVQSPPPAQNASTDSGSPPTTVY